MRSHFLSLLALSLSTSHLCSADPGATSDGAAASTAMVDLGGETPVVTQPKRPDVGGGLSLLLASRETPFELTVWPRDVAADQQSQFALRRVSGAVKDRIEEASMVVANGTVKLSGEKRRALALIASLYTVTPDGKPGKAVFSKSHLDELLAMPVGEESIVDVLGARAAELLDAKKSLPERVADAKND